MSLVVEILLACFLLGWLASGLFNAMLGILQTALGLIGLALFGVLWLGLGFLRLLALGLRLCGI